MISRTSPRRQNRNPLTAIQRRTQAGSGWNWNGPGLMVARSVQATGASDATMSRRLTRHGVTSMTLRQPSQRIATLSLTIVRIWTPMSSIGADGSRLTRAGPASELVPPRGFEPLISTLKGWRPRPLDDGGTGRPESTRGSVRELSGGRRLREQEEDDRAGQASRADDDRDPAADSEDECLPAAAIDPGPPDRAQRVDGKRDEDDAKDGAAGCKEWDLRGVTDGDRVQGEEHRADQGDRQEDDAGRDASACG